MTRESMGTHLLSFVVGGCIGAVVAILFAPRAGAKTRALLGDKICEGTEYLSTKGQEIKDQAVAFVEKGKRAIVG